MVNPRGKEGCNAKIAPNFAGKGLACTGKRLSVLTGYAEQFEEAHEKTLLFREGQNRGPRTLARYPGKMS